MPRFSIVIPSYNYARYVGRAVESAFANPGRDFEVVVIDDGSTDGTPQVLAAYGDRIRAVRQENRGLSGARNRGVDESCGEYLIFLDADDRLLPGALPALREFLAERPKTDVAFGGYVSIDERGWRKTRRARPLSRRRETNFRRYVNHRFSIVNGAAAIHRRVFDGLRYHQGCRQGEDLVFFARVLASFDCASLPDPLMECFAHGGRMRNDFAAIRRAGTKRVDLLFDPRHLPPHLMRYRHEHLSRTLLSLFRTHYLHGDYRGAQALYAEAIRLRPGNLLCGSYLSKYVRSLVKSTVARTAVAPERVSSAAQP